MGDYNLTRNVDSLVGTDEDDVFTVVGTINSLLATDTVAGGGGQDTLKFPLASLAISPDRLVGLSSIERLDVTAASGGVIMTLDATLIGQADGNAFTVAHGDSPLSLGITSINPGDNVFLAGNGQVTLRKFDNQKVTVADGFNGRVAGGIGNDTIVGGNGNDTLSGGDEADTLVGGAGNDVLSGDLGNDVIVSGDGSDVVSGGEGSDLFQVGSGTTKITDFEVNFHLERIDLRGNAAATGFSSLAISDTADGALVQVADTTILLAGVTAAQVGEGNFYFSGDSAATVINVAAGTSQADIQRLLDDSPPGATIRLAEGTYTFDKTLRISRDDITFEGAGSDKTIIRSLIPDSNAASTIEVRTTMGDNRFADFAATATKGSNTVQLTSVSNLKVGDVLYLAQSNDAAFLAETGNTGLNMPADPNADPLRESLSKIVAINGTTVTLAEPLPYTFQGGKAWAGKPDLLRDVTVGGFRIETAFAASDPKTFANTREAWNGVPTVVFKGVADSKLHDVETHNNASQAFAFIRAYGVTADRLTTVGAQNKGSGGNGYAFSLEEVFSSTFTHLTDHDMRHSVLFSAWSAEHYNKIQIDFTNRDVNFHGSPDSGNTIVVDRSVGAYNENTFIWPSVGPGDFPLHPHSTIEANDVRFKYLRATYNDELFHATDDGADIDAGGGDDLIHGGLGADILVGGEGNDAILGNGGNDRISGGRGLDGLRGGTGDDVLSGDEGADILDGEAGIDTLFGGEGNDLLRLGSGDAGAGGAGSDTFVITGNATITDFAVADPLEKIDLRAIKTATGFSTLKVAQVGADASVTVGGITIVLKNVAAKSLTAGDFVFSGDNALTIAQMHTRAPDSEITRTNDRLVGTAGNDLFGASAIQFATKGTINGGGGTDTLRLASDNIGLTADALARLTSVEIIDVSQATGSVTVDVGAAGVGQADGDRLTIYGGSRDITLSTTALGKAGTVVVETFGTVNLRKMVDNVVTVSDAVQGKVVGNTGRDTITGGRQADTLWGGNDDDVLVGGGGDDVLDGGLGDDVLDGGLGSDRLIGGNGYDLLTLGSGDVGTGGAGSDVFAITGNATVMDFSVTDQLEKIDLRGIKAAKNYAALKIAQAGSDTKVSVGGITFVLKNVSASKIGEDDFIYVGETVQTMPDLHNRPAAGVLTAGADRLVGTAGNDLFEGSALQFTKVDSIIGGKGTDTLSLVSSNVGLTDAVLGRLSSVEVIDASQTTGSVSFTVGAAGVGQADGDRLTLIGGMKDITLDTGAVGKAGTVVVETYGTVNLRKAVNNAVTVSDAVQGKVVGNTGNDTIIGGRKADTLSGGNGDDVLVGGGGNDVLDGGLGDDRLDGGLGSDRLIGGNGYDLLTLGSGDVGTGGAGSDVFAITGNATVMDFSVTDQLEKIDLRGIKAAKNYAALKIAQAGSDTKVSVGGITFVLKNVGASKIGEDDFIYFGQTMQTKADLHSRPAAGVLTAGADRLVGTAGNDLFEGSALQFTKVDSIIGGKGTDTLALESSSVGLTDAVLGRLSSVEVIDVSKTTGSVTFTVGAAGVGQADGDRLTLVGGMKDINLDTGAVGKAGTVVVETYGTVNLRKIANNTVTVSDAVQGKVVGNTGNDTIIGGRKADMLSGGNGNDVLVGGGGDDVLSGGLQNDRLTGGAGADTFVFATVPSPLNVDRVTDFASEDTIQLAKSVFAALAPGQLAAGAFKNLGVAGSKLDADDRMIYNHKTGVLAYDADGSGKTAAVTIATFDNKALLTHADFFVV